MLEHLTASFENGGHNFSRDAYEVAWMDWEELHASDHDPAAWFAEVITHTHQGDTDDA